MAKPAGSNFLLCWIIIGGVFPTLLAVFHIVISYPLLLALSAIGVKEPSVFSSVNAAAVLGALAASISICRKMWPKGAGSPPPAG